MTFRERNPYSDPPNYGPMKQPPRCLLPDNATAVERLEPIMEAHGLTHPDRRCGRKCATPIIAALREGGQRK